MASPTIAAATLEGSPIFGTSKKDASGDVANVVLPHQDDASELADKVLHRQFHIG